MRTSCVSIRRTPPTYGDRAPSLQQAHVSPAQYPFNSWLRLRAIGCRPSFEGACRFFTRVPAPHRDSALHMISQASETPHPGLFAHAAGLLAALIRYFKARAALVGIEAKEAGANYGMAVAFVAAALLLGLLAYVFLIITAVFGVAALFEGRHAWIWVMGATALIHAAAAGLLIFIAMRRFKTGAFPLTFEEFSKDQKWLTRLSNNH